MTFFSVQFLQLTALYCSHKDHIPRKKTFTNQDVLVIALGDPVDTTIGYQLMSSLGTVLPILKIVCQDLFCRGNWKCVGDSPTLAKQLSTKLKNA